VADYTLHDIRRSYRSIHARIGTRPEIAERLIGHVVQTKIESIYDRYSYLPEMRQAVQKYEDHLRQLLDLNQ